MQWSFMYKKSVIAIRTFWLINGCMGKSPELLTLLSTPLFKFIAAISLAYEAHKRDRVENFHF